MEDVRDQDGEDLNGERDKRCTQKKMWLRITFNYLRQRQNDGRMERLPGCDGGKGGETKPREKRTRRVSSWVTHEERENVLGLCIWITIYGLAPFGFWTEGIGMGIRVEMRMTYAICTQFCNCILSFNNMKINFFL
ncbi:hypothetical protein Csa_006075 [Cucumis sativus]|uniref:Uncharacterized protein n=1 Tax=Cucumis sativus TaxID=3659 RepID=A0A0A0LI63_CUCSA|nr:hypothetical protein Csa_006075 [Cucumis sativus]